MQREDFLQVSHILRGKILKPLTFIKSSDRGLILPGRQALSLFAVIESIFLNLICEVIHVLLAYGKSLFYGKFFSTLHVITRYRYP
jgi:hypothetical protein